MATSPDISTDKIAPVRARYPHQVTLANGRTGELRLMGDEDRDAVLAFARNLPADSLVYLQTNITKPEVVDEWLSNISHGRTITILAYEEGRLIGEGSLDRSATTWTRHIGEIQLQIAPEGQRLGLGRILANEIDTIAKLCGLQMITARMTLDQVAAQAVFRRLGFQREAVLWNYVIAADGKTRNLLIATKRL